ncbi:MAG: hypothetical protein PHC61_10580 [Chitinivibrionales bacterium]|nr:hypothetical protein [Chitinivibrionales bacterium]
MLALDQLNSATWQAIAAFYDDPINVPQGELPQLAAVFPELADADLPAPEILQQYAPWSAERIERFFTDYPILRPYEPLLTFSAPSEKSPGSIRCVLAHADSGLLGPAAITLGLKPFSAVHIYGKVSVTNPAVLWKNRAISYRPVRGISLDFGNFYNAPAATFLYGHFFDPPDASPTTRQNWA